MGQHVINQLREFSLCLDIFKSGHSDGGMDEYSRTSFLAANARQVQFLVMSTAKQVLAQRAYHKKVL